MIDLRFRASARHDLTAGLVVFLVALPLCLGIALASGAPLSSGIIAGIVGGIVVPLISRASLSVSGPAAGLTAIVLMGLEQAGTFEIFLGAVILSGLFQIGLGVLQAGQIVALVPSSVIKGMLAAIGLILVLKQFPHAIGYDVEAMGAEGFVAGPNENTFSVILHAFQGVHLGAVAISAVSLLILMFWSRVPIAGRVTWLPPALIVVLVGIGMNMAFAANAPGLLLSGRHLVELPIVTGFHGFFSELRAPDWSAFTQVPMYELAVTIAIVASIETLLSIEAVDRLDPFKRRTPVNRELLAQGVGNTLSGLMGGLPITSVIVRSSTAINSGGRTRLTAFSHGIFLLMAVIFTEEWLNRIPLACLAAILLQIGYKLAQPSLFAGMYRRGLEQFVPFVATVVAILMTDLLRGVVLGLIIGIVFALRNTGQRVFVVQNDGDAMRIRFNKDVLFIHKAAFSELLQGIEPGTRVVIDATEVEFIDHDVREAMEEFRGSAPGRGIEVEVLTSDSAGPAKSSPPRLRRIETVVTDPPPKPSIPS